MYTAPHGYPHGLHSLRSGALKRLVAACSAALLPSLLGISECQQPCEADSDSDGVCDENEVCPGGDDLMDADTDGIPDGCDLCPFDASNDSDNDGICDAGALVHFSVPPPRDQAILQRNAQGFSKLELKGTAPVGYATATLEVWKDGSSLGLKNQAMTLDAQGNPVFDLSMDLPAGLQSYRYRLSLGSSSAQVVILDRSGIAVGELLLIQGQSNAVAADYYSEGLANPLDASPWIRSFGSASMLGTEVSQDDTWHQADGQTYYAPGSVGVWGLRLARHILDEQHVPVGLLNGAVGGTSISQHARNDANPEDLNTIYGRFLLRARRSNMAGQAPLMFWYQGESDAIGWGPSSNAANYTQRFTDLHADWKADMPALRHFYVLQIRNGCGVDLPRDGDFYLIYLDAAGAWLSADRYPFEGGSDWQELSLESIAPADATQAAVFLMSYGQGAQTFDDAALQSSSQLDLLSNGDFETGTTLPSSWLYYTGGTYKWALSPVHGGARSISVDASSGTAIVYQTVPIVAGQAYSASSWVLPQVQDAYTDMREVLRALPTKFSDVSLMSTNGAPQHDGCHFYTAGYWELGDRLARVVARDYFGSTASAQVEAPQVTQAHWTSATTLELTVQDPQAVLTAEDGTQYSFFISNARVVRVVGQGGTLLLTLDRATTAKTLSYLPPVGDGPDIYNSRGVGMLSFFELPVQ